MKDAEFVPVRDSGEDEAVGRQAVVLSAGELAVGVNGAAFNRLVELQDGQREQLLE